MNGLSPAELSELVRDQRRPLVMFASQRCDVPDDVVQEAFVKLVQQERPDNPVAWLYQVVRNGAINAARSQRRRTRHELEFAKHSIRQTESNQIFLDEEQISNAMKNLPIEMRETIVARIWGQLSFEEIANLTGTSTSSAWRFYVAALEKLREVLDVSPTKSSGKDS